MSHQRVHTFALAALAAISLMSFVFLIYLLNASIDTRLPPWFLPWAAAINLGYAVAIVATLFGRRIKPEKRRGMTSCLNWALLPAFPGGTIVGLYGLLFANKENRSATV